MNIQRMIACEKAYLEYFCQIEEQSGWRRYVDNQLVDMYCHNFIELDTGCTNPADMLQAEYDQRKAAACPHCRVTSYGQLPPLDSFPSPDFERNGFYIWQEDCSGWKAREDVEMRRFTLEHLEDWVYIDVAERDTEKMRDFADRRTRRVAPVFSEEPSLELYLCYVNGKASGQFHLFRHEDTIKLENFVVIPAVRRTGVGTAMMKFMLTKAKDASLIYLVADENDTPKNMYMNMGFRKAELEQRAATWMF